MADGARRFTEIKAAWKAPPECQPLDKKEQETIKALKAHFGDKWPAVTESMQVRFVRGYAKEKDPYEAARSALAETLTFRAEEKVDLLLKKEFEKLSLWKKAWPGSLHGFDKHGRPMYIERPGQVNPAEINKLFSIDEMKELHLRMMEEIGQMKEKLSLDRGTLIYKHTVILDLAGLTRNHFASDFRKPFKAISNIDQNYYPETLARLYIINAPFVFKMIWAVVKPWLHSSTQARIQILGDNYLKEIEKEVDLSMLPVCIGGSCSCGENKCMETDFCEAHGFKFEKWEKAQAAAAAAAKKKEEETKTS